MEDVMRLLGSHLNLCDPQEFHRAWEKLGDLSDAECDLMAAKIRTPFTPRRPRQTQDMLHAAMATIDSKGT
jgi:hypothetical protein